MKPDPRFVLVRARITPRCAFGRFGSNPFLSDVALLAYHGFAVNSERTFAGLLDSGPRAWIKGSALRQPFVLPLHSDLTPRAIVRAPLLPYLAPMASPSRPFYWDGWVDLQCGLGDFGPRGSNDEAPSAASVVLPRVRLGEQRDDAGPYAELLLPSVGWHVSMESKYEIPVLDWKRSTPSHQPCALKVIPVRCPPRELPPAAWCNSGMLLQESIYFEIMDAFPASYFDILPQPD